MATSSPEQSVRFRLDLDKYQLFEGDGPVRLERQPMELLIFLLERRGQLVTRDDIAGRLWADGVFVDTDRNINSIVRKLRQALRDDPDHPAFLETVVGKGYRFVGPVEIVSSRQLSEKLPPVASAANSSISRARIALVVVVLVTGSALTLWTIFRNRSDAALQPRSIAVLPLANLSGDNTQEYFADGITQELTTELAQVTDLRVISHTSVLQYKSSGKSVPEIARDLHVDAVLEGSVARVGDRVRVSAQLIRAPSDRAIWASSYERNLRDVLTLQHDIATDIAEQIKIKLARNDAVALRRAVNPEAHDLYLKGLFDYEKDTEAGLQEAIALFQKASAADPTFAASYAATAAAYLELGVISWPPQRAMPPAKAAALKALELDPSLAAAHVSLGSVDYFYEWDWNAAQREAQTAISLNASDAYAHDLLASYYGTVGRFDDSRVELQRARELAPLSAEILGDTVMWAFMSRNYDRAVADGVAVTALQPENGFAQVFLGMAYAEQGHVDEALRRADLAVRYDNSPLIASFRANVYALGGRKNQAIAALRNVEKQRVERYSCAYEIGSAYVVLGQPELGFRWLNNAYEARSECMILAKVDPRLDRVRSDPRYRDLLRKVGLSD